MSDLSVTRLYLSTSSPLASFGLETDGRFEWIESPQRARHSDLINSQIASLYEALKISYNQTSQIILDHGPGSFTGVRVAVSFAKAFSYSVPSKIYSLNSLMALKKSTDPERTVYALNAFRNSVYYLNSKHEVEKKSLAEFDLLLKQIDSPSLIIGDALSVYEAQISTGAMQNISASELRYPHVLQLFYLLKKSPQYFKQSSWDSLLPFYLRLSSAEEALQERETLQGSN